MIWFIKKFTPYSHDKFIIRNVHQAKKKWLFAQKDPKERLARWMMKIASFNYEFEQVRGKDNFIADRLSRGVCSLYSNFIEENFEPLSDDKKHKLLLESQTATGQGGRDAMIAFLKEKSTLLGKKQDFLKFISSSFCEIFGKRKVKYEEIRLKYKEPFDRMGIDIIVLLPKTDRGYKYLIVCTDHTSRWAKVRPVKNKERRN